MKNKNTWWYRLLKVVFWLFFIIVYLVIAITLIDEDRPYKRTGIDFEKSYIQCDKDKESDSVYFFNKNSLYATPNPNELSDYSKDRSEEICSKLTPEETLQVAREETRLYTEGYWNSTEINSLLDRYKSKFVNDKYTVHFEEKTEKFGSTQDLIINQLLILIATLILMYLVSSIFKYVAFGEKFSFPIKKKRVD